MPPWAVAGDVPANVLNDFKCDDKNELSVWRVADDRSNLKLVLTALASGTMRLDKLDYALFDEALLTAVSIKAVPTPGKSGCPAADAAHRDLVQLTAAKVANLAREMMPATRVRLPEVEVTKMLTQALETGVLDRDKTNKDLLAKLDEVIAAKNAAAAPPPVP